MCDQLVAAGVRSILNFAPVVLQVPGGVEVRKVDLAVELQILAFHVSRRAEAPAVNGRAVNGVRPMSAHAASSRGGAVMTVLVVGLSHRSAPVDVLERAAVAAPTCPSS